MYFKITKMDDIHGASAMSREWKRERERDDGMGLERNFSVNNMLFG